MSSCCRLTHLCDFTHPPVWQIRLSLLRIKAACHCTWAYIKRRVCLLSNWFAWAASALVAVQTSISWGLRARANTT